MKKLSVIYRGWGERFELGSLADDGEGVLFEYSRDAVERGLEFSPHKLPLREKAYGDFPQHQLGLPGLINDALPDGWGMLLMDRLLRKQGKRPEQISPLVRLAFIGDTAMGALSFEPSEGSELTQDDVQLLTLAKESGELWDGGSEELLRKFAIMGGSPHGARPKVLVYFDRANNRMTNWQTDQGVPMLVKFPAQSEHKEVCAIEALYGRMAVACGLKMPRTEYFDLDKNLSAFAIERFDRSDGHRILMHTLAGAAHVDFRIPQLGYINFLRLTRRLTNDEREVLKAYERCVFNVIFNNRDDHSKNFSYLLEKDGKYRLSPAYDLTYSTGPGGQHQMDVGGEAHEPIRKNLLEVAKKNMISEKVAINLIEQILQVASNFDNFADEFSIRKNTLKDIKTAIRSNCDRLGS